MGQHNDVCFNDEVTETRTTVSGQAYLFQQASAVLSRMLHSPSGDVGLSPTSTDSLGLGCALEQKSRHFLLGIFTKPSLKYNIF